MTTQQLFEYINEKALAEMKQYSIPSRCHYDLALSVGERVSKLLGESIDPFIVKCGVALMDIKLGQCFIEKRPQEHVTESYNYTKQLLEDLGVDGKIKDILYNCVLAHHGKVPYESVYAEICANADCYRFLTPQGIVATIITNSQMGMEQNATIDYCLSKIEEKYNLLTLDICKEELKDNYESLKSFLNNARIK